MPLGLGNMLSKGNAMLSNALAGLSLYFRPDGVSRYKRPDGTSNYIRP
jgi:hypothetical protein